MLSILASLKDRIEIAGERISKDAKYEEIELLDDEITSIPATDDVKNFSYTLIDDEVITEKTHCLSKNSRLLLRMAHFFTEILRMCILMND